MGIIPQHLLAHSPNPGRDLLSIFRSGKSPVPRNEGVSNAASYHRLAKTFAEQNDVSRANTNFSLALRHATPRQVAGIVADYATFLTEIGDLRKAELMLRQALTQSPHDTEITRMLARCLVRQDRMIEGLRHFRAIGTEAEAKAEIAAIYLERGDAEKLAMAERKWGIERPDAVRPVPALIAVAPRPGPVSVQPEPVLVATAPRPVVAPPLPRAATQTLSPSRVPVTPRVEVVPTETVMIAAAPVSPPLSKSEFFDTRIPIPVPRTAPLPAMIATNSPKPVPALSGPAPAAAHSLPERLVLTNPVRLAAAPLPVLPAVNAKEPPKPTVAIQPRRHYVVNAGTSADLSTLLPDIRPAGATVPTQNTRHR